MLQIEPLGSIGARVFAIGLAVVGVVTGCGVAPTSHPNLSAPPGYQAAKQWDRTHLPKQDVYFNGILTAVNVSPSSNVTLYTESVTHEFVLRVAHKAYQIHPGQFIGVVVQRGRSSWHGAVYVERAGNASKIPWVKVSP